MERNVAYFMRPFYNKRSNLLCVFYGVQYEKQKTGAIKDARPIRIKISLESSPQIIVRAAISYLIFTAILVEHTLEDRHIAGRHINDLEPNIEGRRIDIVRLTPLAASDKNH